jgi:hypothetical protein
LIPIFKIKVDTGCCSGMTAGRSARAILNGGRELDGIRVRLDRERMTPGSEDA